MIFINSKFTNITNITIILAITLLLVSTFASSKMETPPELSNQISSTLTPSLPSNAIPLFATAFEKPGETLNTSSGESSSSSSGSTSTTPYVPPPEGTEWYNFTNNPLRDADRDCAFYDNGEENSLIGINYDFDLPVTAIVTGIEVQVLHAPWNSGNFANLSIELYSNNRQSLTSTGYFDYVDGSYHGFDSAFKNVTFGSFDDDWGRSWSSDDFSYDNFGVRLVCTDFIGSESVDIAWVKLHYTDEPVIVIQQLDIVTIEYDALDTAYLNWSVFFYSTASYVDMNNFVS
ncbi:MAG: hypothetical protein ACTSYA_10805, partial [Candidatus Kariarchaeaceae archaeon]